MYEPHDLDKLTPHDVIDTVIRDVHAHQVDPGPGGFLTATRHIGLISHLVTRLSGDALHYAEQAHKDPRLPWRPVEALTVAAVPLGQALARYTQALVRLAALTQPTEHRSMAAALDRIELHSAMHTHLHVAQHPLAETRVAVYAPRPTPVTSPPQPTSPAEHSPRRPR
ncbi:hypothetical protein [Streptomyces sp. NPDC019890]|uniref:hypothetical protein n=1 Tax=Streptomyces sp. NPDC019890 TaxID=3365064 RepID=UPI0038510906